MKFCKSLQKIAELSDPSYAPFWCNYKYLKKMIKAMAGGRDAASVGTSLSDPSMDYAGHHHDYASFSPKISPRVHVVSSRTSAASVAAASTMSPPPPRKRERPLDRDEMSVFALEEGDKESLKKNPREVAFFRFVHAEVNKAVQFFDKVERECIIREQLVTVGMEILQKPQACIVKDRWSVTSRAIFFLYRDLLLLETFAIMTYFSFSKILKKHDKVTGYKTRDPFMVNVVNKANFTNYPKIMELISRCQALYNEASEKLEQDLHEDERLFLNMVSEWNKRNRDVEGGANSSEVTEGLSLDNVMLGVSHRPRTGSASLPARHDLGQPLEALRTARKRARETSDKGGGKEDDNAKKPRAAK